MSVELVKLVDPSYVDLGKDGSAWHHDYVPANAAAVALKAHKSPGTKGVKLSPAQNAARRAAKKNTPGTRAKVTAAASSAAKAAPAPKVEPKPATPKPRASKPVVAERSRSDVTGNLYQLDNKRLEAALNHPGIAPERKHALQIEKQRRLSAMHKVLMKQADDAKKFVHEELPKTDLSNAKEAGRFFRGLYKIMPSLRKKLEPVRQSRLAGKISEINYVEKVIGSIVEETVKGFVDLGLKAALAYVGVKIAGGG